MGKWLYLVWYHFGWARAYIPLCWYGTIGATLKCLKMMDGIKQNYSRQWTWPCFVWHCTYNKWSNSYTCQYTYHMFHPWSLLHERQRSSQKLDKQSANCWYWLGRLQLGGEKTRSWQLAPLHQDGVVGGTFWHCNCFLLKWFILWKGPWSPALWEIL